jgi:hypothetical protein
LTNHRDCGVNSFYILFLQFIVFIQKIKTKIILGKQIREEQRRIQAMHNILKKKGQKELKPTWMLLTAISDYNKNKVQLKSHLRHSLL